MSDGLLSWVPRGSQRGGERRGKEKEKEEEEKRNRRKGKKRWKRREEEAKQCRNVSSLSLYQTSKRKEGMVSERGGDGLVVELRDPRPLF